jgi:hypothetical protein
MSPSDNPYSEYSKDNQPAETGGFYVSRRSGRSEAAEI